MKPNNFIIQKKTPPTSQLKLFYAQAIRTLFYYYNEPRVIVLDLDELTMKSNPQEWGVRNMGGNRTLKKTK